MKEVGSDSKAPESKPLGPWARRFYWALGMLMLVLAIIGAILPVMPTTIFVILAAACFSRASPRWEAYLLNHPQFGPSLVAWRREGAIPAKGKAFATAGISFGLAMFWIFAHPSWWLGAIVTVFMVGTAIWILSRPKPSSPST